MRITLSIAIAAILSTLLAACVPQQRFGVASTVSKHSLNRAPRGDTEHRSIAEIASSGGGFSP